MSRRKRKRNRSAWSERRARLTAASERPYIETRTPEQITEHAIARFQNLRCRDFRFGFLPMWVNAPTREQQEEALRIRRVVSGMQKPRG